MYVSLNWLKNFVDIPSNVSPKDLAETLSLKTAEVENIFTENELLNGVIVGLVEKIAQHPNADKLKIATISIGKEKRYIVCGGQNLKEKMFVAYAPSGCKVKWHGQDELITLEKTKIRSIESDGMICASEEIGLEKPSSEGTEDILDLSSFNPIPGQEVSEVLNLNDTIIEFDNKSLTHRPDLWGMYGIAREISAIYDTKFKPLNPSPKIPEKGEQVKITIKNPDLCQRYCGVIIKNVKIQESPKWMQKHLQAIGNKCHNNIVDITNYISAELGQPLHAFDKRLIKNEIIVRTAKKGETITTLDEIERKLDENMLLICNESKPLAIAGVMGGMESGIQNDTTDIIIESATFLGSNIRKTSTALGLRTDSVQRFEKQLDPNLSMFAMLRAIELILETNPQAVVAGPINDQHEFISELQTVELSVKKTASKIGIDLDKNTIIDILERLHFSVKNTSDEDMLSVTIPSFRAQKDITTANDLIEEIARIYGYDKIPALLPHLPSSLPIQNNKNNLTRRLRNLLTFNLNFNEVLTYSFYSKESFEKCNIADENYIEIENYLSEDHTHMRTSLLPNLLEKTVLNTKYSDDFNIFEIGNIYHNSKDFFPVETEVLAGLIVKKGKQSLSETFYTAKGSVEQIIENEEVAFYKLAKGSSLPYAHPIKSALLSTQTGEVFGNIFAIHPSVIKKHDLESYSISAFEINLQLLLNLAKKQTTFKEISKFPSITFDVSVIVPETAEIEEIKNIIKKSNKSLIQEITLFDFYQGQNIENGKKAVAFKIVLASNERTLSDAEMQEVQNKIFNNLKAFGGIIRGA